VAKGADCNFTAAVYCCCDGTQLIGGDNWFELCAKCRWSGFGCVKLERKHFLGGI
jgi:hypothetical protein